MATLEAEDYNSKLHMELQKMKLLLMKKERRLDKYNRVLSSKKHVQETIQKHRVEQEKKNVHETKMKEEEEEHFNRIKACPEKSVTFQDDEKVKKAQISDSTKIISLKENQNMKNSDSDEPLKKDEKASQDLTNLKIEKILGPDLSQKQDLSANTSYEQVLEPLKEVSSPKLNAESIPLRKSEVLQRMEMSGFSPLNSIEKKTELKNQKNLRSDDLLPSKNGKKLKRTLGLSIKCPPVKRLFTEMEDCVGGKPSCDNLVQDSVESSKNNSPNLSLDNEKNLNFALTKIDQNKLLINNNHLHVPLSESNKDKKNHFENNVWLTNKSPVLSPQNSNLAQVNTNYGKNTSVENLRIIQDEEDLGNVFATSITLTAESSPTLLLVGTGGFSIWKASETEGSSDPTSNLIWNKSYSQQTDIFKSLYSSNFCILGGGWRQETNFIIVHTTSSVAGHLKVVLLQHASPSEEVKVLTSSTTLKVCVGLNSGDNSEEELVLWQDSSGLLGFTDGHVSFPIPRSSQELQEALASGVILYAAVVKEILLLILKERDECRFLAVNPATGQFEDFYQITLSKDVSSASAIYHKNKFFFFTSKAELHSLAIV